MANTNERLWLWGYTLDTIPGPAFFVNGDTSCSLETAAKYLGCGGVFWMNGLHNMDAFTEKNMDLLTDFNVISGLTHIETNGPGKGGWKLYYRESAEKLARLSLKYPNIKGAIIDDFHCFGGPSENMTAEDLKVISSTMKEINPALKMYLVQYHVTHDPEKLADYLDYFDGLTTWSWNSSDYFWKTVYEIERKRYRRFCPGKELIQGMFVNAYGDGDVAQPMDQLELMCDTIADKLDANMIDGWCALQAGHLCRTTHRRQAQFLHEYWKWYCETRTVR